jgi:hypothetical protein
MPLLFLVTETITGRVQAGLSFSKSDAGLKQAHYIAEAGETAALYELTLSDFSKATHKTSGIAIPARSSQYLPATLSNTVRDHEGWHQWEWNPGDSHKNFTSSGLSERYRYKISKTGGNRWLIEVESTYGDRYQNYRRKILKENHI